jgi:hypothetical protein
MLLQQHLMGGCCIECIHLAWFLCRLLRETFEPELLSPRSTFSTSQNSMTVVEVGLNVASHCLQFIMFHEIASMIDGQMMMIRRIF